MEASPVVSQPAQMTAQGRHRGTSLPQVSIRICDDNMNWQPPGLRAICVQGLNVIGLLA